jgi:hypothetical protein
MANAAGMGHLVACQYLAAEQCPSDARACEYAAAAGHLETVCVLHESDCPWKPETMCASAAESGNLELLQYVREQGCDLSQGVMEIAAERGDLPMCQYLRAQQCPWNRSACDNAAAAGHVDTLRWLHEQGCPCDVEYVRMRAAQSSSVPTLT